MRKKRHAYRIFVGKPEVKRPLGRKRHRLVHIIEMELIEIGWGNTAWVNLTLDSNQWMALVNTVMNLWVP
jgi:hypothetical protein